MPSTDSTVARRIFGRCASKTQHGGYALWCPALNTAELDRLRDQKFESGSLQRRVRNEPSRGQTNEPRHHHHIAGVNLGRRSCVRSGLGSARHFTEHLLRSGGTKLAHLCRLALPARRYPCIAVDYGPIVH
jgi:hypothetical protein